MATEDVALAAGTESGALAKPDTQQRAPQGNIVNDLSIQIATVNGSGSQSANLVLLKSIFRMGIPVSGKNLFPSNIAGLPTWYTIRASKDGYVARKKEIDVLVAMNPETSKEDMLSLPPGAAAIYEESADLKQFRSDVACYPVPFDKLTAAACPEAKLRKLVKNMVYVGVVAQLLKIDMTAIEATAKRLAEVLGIPPAFLYIEDEVLAALLLRWNDLTPRQKKDLLKQAETAPVKRSHKAE